MNERVLNRIVFGIEVIVTIGLVAVSLMALLSLGFRVWEVWLGGLPLARVGFTSVVSTALEVFILIELIRIAQAYMMHRNVIPTVMEAALVAVARKFVVFEPKGDILPAAVGLSALLLALAISWWLLKQANACELEDVRH